MKNVQRMGYVQENEVVEGTLFYKYETNSTWNENFNSQWNM